MLQIPIARHAWSWSDASRTSDVQPGQCTSKGCTQHARLMWQKDLALMPFPEHAVRMVRAAISGLV